MNEATLRPEELPVDYTDRMRTLLGDEYDAFAASYGERRKYGLRINPLKADTDEILSLLGLSGDDAGSRVAWCREGFYYDKDSCQAGRSPYHEAGAYYIQEPSAMSVTEVLDPQPGERICDLCAAPGGKSTHIAGRMMGKGILVSNEIVPDRAKILSSNIERMGIPNCVVVNASPDEMARAFAGYFHRVCVDAPCSGEGMFRKDETALTEWSIANVEMCAARQADILEAAQSMVMPGGTLVYSTCTFEPDENERLIAGFLSGHPEWSIVPATPEGITTHGRPEWCDGAPGIEHTVRIWPHISAGEGHFVARLVKAGNSVVYADSPVDSAEKSKRRRNEDLKKSDGKICAEAVRFLHAEVLSEAGCDRFGAGEGRDQNRYRVSGDHIYLLPDGFDDRHISHLRVLRSGAELALIRKNRFEPAHALAMMLDPREVKNACDLNAEEAVRYIRGETFTPACVCGGEPSQGWTLVCINGLSLGWGKMVGSTLKNHYPKGLRRDLAIKSQAL